MGKETQKAKVLEICKEHCPARTEQLEIIGLRAGISGGSVGRYLRYLAREKVPKVKGEKKKDDKTKTWTICEPDAPIHGTFKENHEKYIDVTEPIKPETCAKRIAYPCIEERIGKPLTFEFMQTNPYIEE